MKTTRWIYPSLGALALVTALTALTACNSTLGLDVAGDVKLALAKMNNPIIGFPPSQPDTAVPQRSVQPDTVSSFHVTVTAVQFLRTGSDTSSGSPGWTTMQLNAPVDVDLMALPAQSDSSSIIAAGRLQAGTYAKVRLLITNPRIRFKGTIGFGVGSTLQGGVDYAVTIPSGAQSDLTADATISVAAGSSGTAHLVFDQNATLGNVMVTGTGTVMLQTVLHGN